jgi:hypothetical protein
MPAFNLIVAEGHWKNHSNHSVKSLFDLLSDLLHGTGHAYKYVQFADSTAFDSCIKGLAGGTYEYLYIGSHGTTKGIYGFNNANPLSRTIIINRIQGMSGLFLGACDFGQPETLKKILADTPSLAWCAGYRKSVNWIDSSLLDLAFWKIHQRFSAASPALTPATLIEQTITELQLKYASLILDLGFNVALRRTDAQGKPVIELAF